MNIRYSKLLTFLALAVGLLISPVFLAADESTNGTQAERIYLSGKGPSDAVEWDFFCTKGRKSGKWSKIPVPSNWEQHGFGNYDYGTQARKIERHDDAGKYKTRFFASEDWKDKHVRIVFEASMTETTVFLNDKQVGFPNHGAYHPFRYMLNDFLKYGEENELEVHVLKKPTNYSLDEAERYADYWIFGGIYRPVYLEIQPMQFVNRVAIDAKADGSFQMDVFPQVHNKTSFKKDVGVFVDEVVAQIRTLDGTPVGQAMSAPTHQASGRIRLETKINKPALWSPENPNLYKVEVTLKKEGLIVFSKLERFGFRTFERRYNDGLYLNGQKIRIKGVNRNVFDPIHARAIDAEECWKEARQIKSMNVNLVRSHLPPTTDFSEACDELGLLVITELCNWHDPYIDTHIARNIAFELVAKYQNHPSVILWANGNEGGFNPDIDDLYHLVDLQNRPVIHPWTTFEGIETYHYPTYPTLVRKLKEDVVFLPTEFLHGLYDGGHGAGLDDYWNAMMSSPIGAGGVLWCWADAAISRTDKKGELDTYGNRSADGLVGPNGEPEASFYTAREIWSPIQIPQAHLPSDFSGKLPIENLYYETNLNECTFKGRLVSYQYPFVENAKETTIAEFEVKGPKVKSGKSGVLNLKSQLKGKLDSSDALLLTAYDPDGVEVLNWGWSIKEPSTVNASKQSTIQTVEGHPFEVKVENVVWSFSPQTGQLLECTVNGKDAGVGKGPVLYAGNLKNALEFDQNWSATASKQGDHYIIESSNQTGSSFQWTIHANGTLNLGYHFSPIDEKLAYCAVGFDLPEDAVSKKRWLGKGPHRVWSNRLKGPTYGLWENDYNDHQTGINWGKPEFKGIFGDVDWMKLDLKSGVSLLVDTKPGTNVGVLYPKNPPKGKDEIWYSSRANWHYPTGGGLHLFHKLPGVGSKMMDAEMSGPQGAPQKIEGPIKGSVKFQLK